MSRDTTIIIACLNEEENVLGAYQTVVEAAANAGIDDIEILIFNDGSTDRTGAVIDDIAAKDSRVKAIHNGVNRGFGYNFIRGVELSSKAYVAVFPGDNEIAPVSVNKIMAHIGMADVVIPHTINMEIRPYSRRFLSRLFTLIMNSLFCCELQYYNGPCVHRRSLLKEHGPSTFGFAFQAVTLTKLIRSGFSFIEVDMYLQPKPSYRSSALRISNVLRVGQAIAKLFYEVYFDTRFRRVEKINRVIPSNN